jgi:hypothetical protein
MSVVVYRQSQDIQMVAVKRISISRGSREGVGATSEISGRRESDSATSYGIISLNPR